MAVTATPMTEAALRPSVEALVDEIVNGDDSHWQSYASKMAAQVAAGFKVGLFRPWSANNRFYLEAQAKRRTEQVHGMYAGVAQWRDRGRVVRDGEIPFIIFGPPRYFIRNATPQPNAAPAPALNQAAATPAQAGVNGQLPAPVQAVGFRPPPVIEVYDYSQTVATDPDFIEPDWSVPLAGGDLGTLHRLTEVSPVPVTFRDIGSKLEHGWLDKTGITVDSSQTAAEQIWTLAHELGHHHLGHLDRIASTRGAATGESESVRAQCEQEAALVQFFVLKMLGLDESVGIDITASAGAYLRSWVKTNDDGTTTPIAGHKGRRKLLKARFDVSFRAAQTIVAAYAELDHQAATAA